MMDESYFLQKSSERRAFEHFLRTGRRPPDNIPAKQIERKFNPYHDPRNGQFTFAPGGPRSPSRIIIASRDGVRRIVRGFPKPDAGLLHTSAANGDELGTAAVRNAPFLPTENPPGLQTANYRPNDRVRIGNNGGPPINDPLTLVRVFPGINSSPGGSILAVADSLLDLTGPSTRLTTAMAEGHINYLIARIRAVDPNYRFESLAFPVTLEGQMNLIARLRLDRAAAYYKIRGEVRPLQVETLRQMQIRADRAYDQAIAMLKSGKLSVRLSEPEAIGNHIDRAVRNDLNRLYSSLGLERSRSRGISVNAREYNTSGSDLTFRRPDARVGDIAFDVTLTQKTLKTAQVRGFFEADFRPKTVIIVRPTQLGLGNTYAITKPGKQP
ncbi:MAG: hypothetical protein ABW184_16345 [Sphingobium sp.]